MKYLLTSFLIFVSFFAIAQNPQTKDSIYHGIRSMKRVQKAEDFIPIYKKFDALSQVDNKDWIPKYYAALSRLFLYTREDLKQQNDKPALLNQAYKLLNEALAIQNNEEVLILKAYCRILEMKSDPTDGFEKNNVEITNLLSEARAINGSNPRLFLMESLNDYYKPEHISGGKNGALASLNEAVSLFRSGEVERYMFMPTWGQKIAEDLLVILNNPE
jgi:hypothetical protein